MPLSVWLLSPRLTGVIRNRASGETSYWNSDGGNKALVGWKGKGHVQGSRAQAETTARAEMKAIQLSLSALRDQTRCQTLCDFTKGGEQTSFFPKCSTHTHTHTRRATNSHSYLYESRTVPRSASMDQVSCSRAFFQLVPALSFPHSERPKKAKTNCQISPTCTEAPHRTVSV